MSSVLTCREFIGFLDDYVDGLLAPERQAVFEAHLAICPACVEYLAGYREAIRLARNALAAHPNDPPPKDVPPELLRAILAARSASG